MLFISYKIEDSCIANEVLQRILERGYSEKQIFLDSDPEAGIEAGTSWETKIYESLKHSRAMIVLCSQNWLKSQWCFVELGYAKAMAISIFPILIEKCDIGSTLGSTQTIDLVTATDAVARDAAFERLWTGLEKQHLGPKENLPWPPQGETDNCPFPGLMYFDEQHAPVYFGREQERDSVIQKLKEMRHSGVPRLLMIVGGSGSGKSSLLRAGVLSWLRHPTEHQNWLVLPTLRYGETPNDDVTLLSRLAEVIADRYPQNHPQRPEWTELRKKFESNDVEQATRDFVDATVKLCRARRENGPRLAHAGDQAPTTLFAIDQFEELLTKASGPSALKFLRFLRTLLSRSNGRLLVIGTIRSDYLDTYERHVESLKSPFLELYPLPPFSPERVTEVIVKPAEQVDVTFTEELITRLKGDAPNSDALPLLAFTLERLFRQCEKRFRHCAGDKLVELHEYEQLGGMSGAITQAVTRILPADLSKEAEQALRRSFVNHLAQLNEKDEFVRRRAVWETLPDAAKPLLAKFIQPERLLQRSGDKGEVVEVTHEAIFRCWDQLKGWLEDDLPALRLRRRVETLAYEWRRSHSAANPLGDDGLLLTRAQLGALDDWLQQSDLVLPELETSFVDASREKLAIADQAAAARQRILRRWAFGAASTIAVALYLALYLKFAVEKATQKVEAMNARVASSSYLLARLRGNEKRFGEAQVLLRSVPTNYRHFEWHYSNRQFDSDKTLQFYSDKTLPEDTKDVTCVSFSRDGTRIIGASSDTVKIWDATSGQQTLTSTELKSPVCFSPDGKRFVSGSSDDNLKICDATTGQELHTLKGHTRSVNCVSFSRDGTRIVSGSDDSTIKLWDVASGKLMRTLEGYISCVSFSPDGKRIVSGYNNTLKLWDAEKGQVLRTFKGHEHYVTSVSFSPDGKWIVSGSYDTTLKLWDATSGQELRIFKGHTRGVSCVSFNPDGTRIVSGSSDTTLKLWNAVSGQELLNFWGHADSVTCVTFSPGGKWIVSGSEDKLIKVWDAAGGQEPRTLTGHGIAVLSVSFSPDGKWIVSGGYDTTLKIWDAASGKEKRTLTGHTKAVMSVSFSRDGKSIVSGSKDNTLKVWDAASGQELLNLPGHSRYVTSVGFSPDGQRIVSGSDDNTVKLWDAASGQEQRTLNVRGVTSVSFSPDGKLIVSGSSDKTLKVWDAASGQELRTLTGHTKRVNSVCFSPDGTRIVSCSDDRTLKVWDAASGQVQRTLMGHSDTVISASYSPDGKRIVSSGNENKLKDNLLKLWDAESGQELLNLEGHTNVVMQVRFSPDGNRIVSCGFDETIKIWDGTPKSWLIGGSKGDMLNVLDTASDQ